MTIENLNPNRRQSVNQCSQILNYLKRGKSITPLEALRYFGCMRLQARIYDLETKRNQRFTRRFVNISTSKKKVMQYTLVTYTPQVRKDGSVCLRGTDDSVLTFSTMSESINYVRANDLVCTSLQPAE